jgi:hypothetical protein
LQNLAIFYSLRYGNFNTGNKIKKFSPALKIKQKKAIAYYYTSPDFCAGGHFF